MNGRASSRLSVAAAVTLFGLAGLAGCHSASTNSAGTGGTTAKTTSGSTSGGSGGGVCSYVTKDQVASFFTAPIKDGVAGTDGSGPGSKDCFYHLQGDDSAGLDLVTDADWNFWMGQFSTRTAVSGIGDEAYSVNNGLALMARKGTATCMAVITISSPGQVNTQVSDDGAVADSQRGPFAQKLGTLCAKVLG